MAGSQSPVYITLDEAGVRLCCDGRFARKFLGRQGITPIQGRVPALVIGRLLADSYRAVWPEADWPNYSDEELRDLRGIGVDAMAIALNGLTEDGRPAGRSTLFSLCRAGKVPALNLASPGSRGRYVLPADLPIQLERRALRALQPPARPVHLRP
jgi:hypothetical protein